MVVSELSDKDLDSASFLYSTAVRVQNPPGELSQEEANLQLRKNFVHKRYHVFVHKCRETDSAVDGILIFRAFGKRAKIFFIGANPPGKGAGKSLLRALGEFCLSEGIGTVQTVVSSVDGRACSFYAHCGFKEVKRKQKEGSGFYEIEMKADAERLKGL
ncbi:Acetyltransferase (GNAT) domain protein [uncultured archaeon]|nr:Acetyltransferase (GNAT) domain protein [uncultured archaeon]